MIDRVKVVLIAGNGGDGKMAFLHEKGKALGGPAGGNGGKGGNIYVKAREGLNSLSAYRFGKTIKAPAGENGHEKNMYGRDAPDVVLEVPIGTVVKDFSTGVVLADLKEDGKSYLAVRGGRGGKGNHCFANSVRKSPKFFEIGQPGEEKAFYFELRLLADAGLVGLPNAGKSTFLGKVTNAKPKIAAYPFTTLQPQLGTVELGDDESFVLADLPGLIEGAHSGRGLGIAFLRHIERCRVIVHVVDLTSEDPYGDFVTINKELGDYSLGLLKRPMFVALNKVDLLSDPKGAVAAFKAKAGGEYSVYPISALTGAGLKPLLRAVFDKLKVTPTFPLSEDYANPSGKVYTLRPEDQPVSFTIKKLEPSVYKVEGEALLNRFQRLSLEGDAGMDKVLAFLEKTGIDQKLHEMDVEDGATIKVGSFEFNYSR